MASRSSTVLNRRVRVLVAVVALVVGTTVWFVAATGADGASSPQAAVIGLVEALEAGDAVGVLESIVPAEREAMADPLATIVERMQATGSLAGAEGFEGPVPGVRIEVDGLALAGGEEISRRVRPVTSVGGTLRVHLDPALVPDEDTRRRLGEIAGTSLGDGVVYERDLAADPIVLVTLGDSGGWHVSPAYTVAETVRRRSGGEVPDLRFEGPETIGSSTAEDVVADLLSSLVHRFPTRAGEVVDPRTARALYQYQSAWFPGVQAAADRAGAEGDWTARVDDLVTHEEGDGEVRRVTIRRLDLTIVDGPAGESVRIQVGEDGCTTFMTVPVVATGEGALGVVVEPGPGVEVRRSCPGQGWTDETGSPVDPGPVGLADLLVLDGLGGAHPGVTVVDRGGRWFVDPYRSVLDSLAEGVEATPDEEVGAWSAGLVDLVLRATDLPLVTR